MYCCPRPRVNVHRVIHNTEAVIILLLHRRFEIVVLLPNANYIRNLFICSVCHGNGTTVKMWYGDTVLRNRIILAACDCAVMYTTCHVTGTTVKIVVPGNISLKPEQTGSNGK